MYDDPKLKKLKEVDTGFRNSKRERAKKLKELAESKNGKIRETLSGKTTEQSS